MTKAKLSSKRKQVFKTKTTDPFDAALAEWIAGKAKSNAEKVKAIDFETFQKRRRRKASASPKSYTNLLKQIAAEPVLSL